MVLDLLAGDRARLDLRTGDQTTCRRADTREAARKKHEAATRKRQATDARDRADAKAGLLPVRALAKNLEGYSKRTATRPGESPLEVLQALRLPDGRPIIEQTEADLGTGWGGRLLTAISAMGGQRWWRSTLDHNVCVLETNPERWGPETQLVVAPAIRELRGVLGSPLGSAPPRSSSSAARRPSQPERRVQTASTVVMTPSQLKAKLNC
jgi:hypothetical protein